MATNQPRYITNVISKDPNPHVMLGLFQAGSSQVIAVGELLELSGGNWIPLDADQSMSAIIAIAHEEIKSGDRAGYYEIIVPRPGDVFEYDLASAAATTVGSALYWSDSETVTTSGNNILGYAVGQEHYPKKQGHLADDVSSDMGTTVRSTSQIQMAIIQTASYYAALFI